VASRAGHRTHAHPASPALGPGGDTPSFDDTEVADSWIVVVAISHLKNVRLIRTTSAALRLRATKSMLAKLPQRFSEPHASSGRRGGFAMSTDGYPFLLDFARAKTNVSSIPFAFDFVRSPDDLPV
jgi:hypothetical protein